MKVCVGAPYELVHFVVDLFSIEHLFNLDSKYVLGLVLSRRSLSTGANFGSTLDKFRWSSVVLASTQHYVFRNYHY